MGWSRRHVPPFPSPRCGDRWAHSKGPLGKRFTGRGGLEIPWVTDAAITLATVVGYYICIVHSHNALVPISLRL
jgi:hypothetical protein